MTVLRTRHWLVAALGMVVLPPAGCGHGRRLTIDAVPRLRVLGTVQDGGLPHAGCRCSHCEGARREPRCRRFVSSLALIVPDGEKKQRVYLIDASPDIREQIELLRDVRAGPAGGMDRAPVDGVFLTHAHIGHYLGLAYFGFESLNTQALPVYCTTRMAAFLRGNGPWSQLCRIGNINLNEIQPGASVELPFGAGHDGVELKPICVPHRDEYSDTVAYVIRKRPRFDHAGARHSSVLFIPDTEKWSTWTPSLMDVLTHESVGVLLVDGTFYSANELPGRSVASIGHPLMRDTMELLEPLVRAGRLVVYFTHLNHSNPALDSRSAAARDIEARGFRVAREGLEIPL